MKTKILKKLINITNNINTYLVDVLQSHISKSLQQEIRSKNYINRTPDPVWKQKYADLCEGKISTPTHECGCNCK